MMAYIQIDAVRLPFAGKDIIEVCMTSPKPGWYWKWSLTHDWPPSQNFQGDVS